MSSADGEGVQNREEDGRPTVQQYGCLACVRNLVSSGLLKLASAVTQAQFVEDVAQSIAAHNSATGKKSL
jgi:hypothetical protein